jgi:hypothetical protein
VDYGEKSAMPITRGFRERRRKGEEEVFVILKSFSPQSFSSRPRHVYVLWALTNVEESINLKPHTILLPEEDAETLALIGFSHPSQTLLPTTHSITLSISFHEMYFTLWTRQIKSEPPLPK